MVLVIVVEYTEVGIVEGHTYGVPFVSKCNFDAMIYFMDSSFSGL